LSPRVKGSLPEALHQGLAHEEKGESRKMSVTRGTPLLMRVLEIERDAKTSFARGLIPTD
jgi:hypothetical protein